MSSDIDDKSILILSGELSGDMHGAALVRYLKANLPGFSYCGMGGDQMAAEGVTLVAHVKDMAIVGVVEVFKSLNKLVGTFCCLMKLVKKKKPKLIILVDYPDFNLIFARWAKRYDIPIIYFISPQVWAWRRGRIKLIKRVVKKILVLFPFEEKMYLDAGVDAKYVGHPLLDEVKVIASAVDIRSKLQLGQKKRVVSLMPGSRDSEIDSLLPLMLQAAEIISSSEPDVEFVLPLAVSISEERVKNFTEQSSVAVKIVHNSTYSAVSISEFVIVASGTATLEVALLGVPLVVCYKVKPISYIIGKMLIGVPYISLANIVAEKKLVPELIQGEMTPGAIAHHCLEVLQNPKKAAQIKRELLSLKERLGEGGAAERAGKEIVSFMDDNHLGKDAF